MKNPAKCRVFVDVVQNTYRQRPQWQSHSCSERMVEMIAVVCFISALYMTSDKKSRLFGSIAGRISTGRDSFAIAIWAVFNSNPVSGHKLYHFVFAWFVLTVTFGSVLHDVSLTYIYNALALKRVDKRNPPKRVSGGFCYEVFPTLGNSRCQRINAIVCIY